MDLLDGLGESRQGRARLSRFDCAGNLTRVNGQTPEVGWVLYDGACGVCSRWVPFWAPTLRRIGLDVAPLQAGWVSERTGLSPDTLIQDLRLLHVDGRLTSGAAVYRYVMRRRWWAWPFYVMSVLPGGRQLFDWGYRTFARHRMQVSAACGLAPPDQAPLDDS